MPPRGTTPTGGPGRASRTTTTTKWYVDELVLVDVMPSAFLVVDVLVWV
jgi:hypothetical protein